ncbi:DUF892 family protein (plasmid) [Phyllobacterium sp. A18/5-2]|uniref:DUF892 family protein n=1 Tax=Phyllobacterium sp. A18/5-2 TaxID=2978392 RepID=UPI0021C7636D|nr:DUF892 family protein [Phyllobacterium sp. A18/5-2]UXN66037.1 DUF892 family protein [Phyllobacterium sp. A18/5-2]
MLQRTLDQLFVGALRRTLFCERQLQTMLQAAGLVDDALLRARITHCFEHSHQRLEHLRSAFKRSAKLARAKRSQTFAAMQAGFERASSSTEQTAWLELALHHLLASYSAVMTWAKALGLAETARAFKDCHLRTKEDLHKLGCYEQHTIHVKKS